MQPLQCVLQHHVHIHAAVTVRFAPARCRTQSRNRLRVNMVTAGCSHYTRKNTKFRAPVSSPQQTPRNIHAAFTLRFAALRAQWCSHYNAICIHALQNTMEEPMTRRNERTRTCRTHELPFIACSHFTRKNTMFGAPASSPKHSPCNSRAAIPLRLVLFCTVWLCDVLLCDVFLCDVLLCDVLFCDVLLCDLLLSDVLLCDVLLCDVLFCDVLLCDVCYVMYCDVTWCIVMWLLLCNVLLCNELLCEALLRDVLLCDVPLCDVL